MFTLSQIVPFGRSLDEYRRMFALSDADLRGTILGCADGPASFNAEATLMGCRVVSCDPLYQFEAEEIRTRIDATFSEVIEQARLNSSQFVWDIIGSPQELARIRMQAMLDFLHDFPRGKKESRYLCAGLPSLPFPDAHFNLALCSHFLFLYSDHLMAAFHERAILEMSRVAREVRIFPLFTLAGQPSVYTVPVMDHLKKIGLMVTIETVAYEFQRGSRQMMRVRRPV
jgi:hypothetical protein